jgi:hypothetical protein
MCETAAAQSAALPRDVRVDQIWFVNELQKHHVDDLKSAVKVRMTGDGLERVEGDFFEGLLVTPTESTVDPAKLLNLYARDKITRAEMISVLSVRKEPLAKVLSGAEIAAMDESKGRTNQRGDVHISPPAAHGTAPQLGAAFRRGAEVIAARGAAAGPSSSAVFHAAIHPCPGKDGARGGDIQWGTRTHVSV